MQQNKNKIDESIREATFELGKKHGSYGADASQMQLFGVLMVEAFLQAIPQDGMEPGKHELIRQAFFAFFRVVVYGMQLGYKYVQICSGRYTIKNTLRNYTNHVDKVVIYIWLMAEWKLATECVAELHNYNLHTIIY